MNAKVDAVAAARAALERVSDGNDAQGAQLTLLVGGTQGRSWLVTTQDGRRLVLRAPAPWSNALRDLTTEARAMTAAADAGLAPHILAVDAEHGSLLTVYRPGVAWRPEDARDPANAARVAALLRELHAVPGELPPFAAERVASDYLSRLDSLSIRVHQPRAAQWADELLLLARRYDSAYSPTVFCHNDLVAANVLDDGTLALVDFEYAVRGTPLLDLASFAGMNGLKRTARRTLLETYNRQTPTTAEMVELGTLVRMVRLFAWFWAEIGAASAPDPTPYVEYLVGLTADLQQE